MGGSLKSASLLLVLLLSFFLLTKGDDDSSPSVVEEVKVEELNDNINVTREDRSVPVVTVDPDCAELNNLGDGYNEATSRSGSGAYNKNCFPFTGGFPGGWPNHGVDDSVAVFVGKNFIASRGAEVEGNVVVLGNLKVASQGPSNFVSVGAGTHVLPSNGGNCIIAGGNLEAYRDIQVFNLRGSMRCDIVYKGTGKNTGRWKTNGRVRKVANFDMSGYEAMRENFLYKSEYWGELPATATVSERYTTTTFYCNDKDEVQIFRINKGDRSIVQTTSYQFNRRCKGKTILINVMGTGTVNVRAAAFYDADGNQARFSTCQAQNMLWNFPQASNVDIGYGWTSEFYGSVLVAGNLKFTTTGHSGRTIVCGTLTHFGWGSEFHSFPFKPEKNLPCNPTPVPTNGTWEMTHGFGEWVTPPENQLAPENQLGNGENQLAPENGEDQLAPENQLGNGEE